MVVENDTCSLIEIIRNYIPSIYYFYLEKNTEYIFGVRKSKGVGGVNEGQSPGLKWGKVFIIPIHLALLVAYTWKLGIYWWKIIPTFFPAD